MVEAVVQRKQQTLSGQEGSHLGRHQADGRIGFLGSPELRFLTAPDIDDPPLSVANAFTLIILRLGGTGKLFPEGSPYFRFGQHKRFIHISPDRTTQAAGSIKEAAPHPFDRMPPELADIRIFLQGSVGVARRVRPFVEQGRYPFPLETMGRAVPLVQVSVYILVVHAQDIIDRLLLTDRSGIAEYNRASLVGCLHPIPALLEVRAVHAFITDRPEQNGGMGTERLHHLAALREIAGRKLGTILGLARRIVLLPVGIDKADSRLALHIDAVAVAILQETFRGRIMRGTDKVHIGTFEEDHIEAVQFGSRRAAECRVDVMAAGPAQLHRHAVHQHAVFLDLHVTETDTAVETADLLSVLAEGDGQRIEVRMFGIPLQGVLHGQFIHVPALFQGEPGLHQRIASAGRLGQRIGNFRTSGNRAAVADLQDGILVSSIQMCLGVEVIQAGFG